MLFRSLLEQLVPHEVVHLFAQVPVRPELMVHVDFKPLYFHGSVHVVPEVHPILEGSTIHPVSQVCLDLRQTLFGTD